MLAAFHIIVAVALVGELLSTIGELAVQRAATLARVKCLEREFDQQLLDQLIARATSMRPKVKRDGKGLTELEFVLAMCIELDVVKWDQVTSPSIDQWKLLPPSHASSRRRTPFSRLLSPSRRCGPSSTSSVCSMSTETRASARTIFT